MSPGKFLILACEAGCLGFYLVQELLEIGLDCRVMALTIFGYLLQTEFEKQTKEMQNPPHMDWLSLDT